MNSISIEPIGIIKTPFKEKFGTPRQSGLTEKAYGKILLPVNQDSRDGIIGLEKFEKIWLIFQFNLHSKDRVKYSIRPPRLGGQKKEGVWGSRSPHRPNNLGLSLVKLENLVNNSNSIEIHISGVDLIDGTPIIDIKPYLPYTDYCPKAGNGWADEVDFPRINCIEFTNEVNDILDHYNDQNYKSLLKEVLSLDPRPAHQRKLEKDFKFKLGSFDISFRPISNGFLVFALEQI